jgi:plasmid stability protein
MTAIERFAQERRLRITRDECQDQVISGSRGHLYFDGSTLCLMALDARGAEPTWAALGGKVWTGGIWRDERNRARRDVWIRNLPDKSVGKALRLLGIRVKRVLSDEERAVLSDRLREIKARDYEKTIAPRG